MLETLLKILAIAHSAPEIILDDDGDLSLHFDGKLAVSIDESGYVNWARTDGRHGSDLEFFLAILNSEGL